MSARSLFKAKTDILTEAGTFILRVATGLMIMFAHGWSKFINFSSLSAKFADPLGIGSEISLGLAVFAEFFCGLFLVLGLFTRYISIPLIIVMLVAVFIVHSEDPFSKQELGLLYLFSFTFFLFAGPGKFSLDAMMGRSRR